MKRLFYLLFVGALCLSITACDSNSAQKTPKIETVTDMEFNMTFEAGERTGKYTGEVIDGIPNGNGKFETVNPAGAKWYYEGEFKDGLFDGNGITLWESGSVKKGEFIKNLWSPKPIELIDYLYYNSINENFAVSDKAYSFISEHANLFPSQNIDDLTEFVDESIEYRKITKDPTVFGDKIMKLKNITVAQIFVEKIEDSNDVKYTYMIACDDDWNYYEIYYFGNVEDVYDGDLVSTIYAIPVNTGGYENIGGGTTNTVALLGCNIIK